MATYSTPRILSILSDYDFSSKQYYFCKFGSADTIVTLCGSGEEAIGIVMNTPTSGQMAEVALPGGGALLKLGGSATCGKYLASMSTGKGEYVQAAGNHIGARAMATGTTNDIIPVEVVCAEAYNQES